MCRWMWLFTIFFFFQAEDGIRDVAVTGVQTCALPICRSPNWLKIRADRTDDFVVVGFTRPKGSRSGFGALDLGAYQDGKLVYGGRVEIGRASGRERG